jgi:hypothetical protein
MTVRVRFLRGTALGGVGNDAAPGDVRELPTAAAELLIAAGRAQELADAHAGQPADTAPAPATSAVQAPAPRRARKSSERN